MPMRAFRASRTYIGNAKLRPTIDNGVSPGVRAFPAAYTNWGKPLLTRGKRNLSRVIRRLR